MFEDKRAYAALASYPVTKGHTIVAWKKKVADIHDLSDKDYDYLMDVLDVARDALLRVCRVKKVYLIYMDEAKQVHWHLVPRYNIKGFNVFAHAPKKITKFPLSAKLRKAFESRYKKRFSLANKK